MRPNDPSGARQLADFLGRWRLERRIRHATEPEARFTGTAIWRPEGQGARYEEQGQLRIPGQAPIHATRSYVWGSDLVVRFDTGGVFHAVPPTGGPVSHWCPPDQYDGRYDFSDWPEFTVTWQVSGPRKAYWMESRYGPEDQADAAGA